MDYCLTLKVAYKFRVDYIEEPLSKWRMHNESESSKKAFLILEENKIMLERLTAEFPEINIKYTKQIMYFLRRLDLKLAQAKWAERDIYSARKYLLPHLKNIKFLILYLSTWILPYPLFDRAKMVAKTKFKLLWRHL